MSTVLVTGGTGFVGGHVILKLLNTGHQVRTTVRSLKKEDEVRSLLKAAGAIIDNNLTFYEADLLKDSGWDTAIAGCDYVLHVASPFPSKTPADENELIIPAKEGTLRILKASKRTGVKRVVLTSSFAAIGYGEKNSNKIFTELDWTDPSKKSVPAYHKSKTIAEQEAWNYIKSEGGNLELSVINPVGIFGPVLGTDLSSSIQIVKMMLEGKMPAVPQIYFGVIDVRDVADLLIMAMTNKKAKGERFLASAGNSISMQELASFLKKDLGKEAQKVPTRQFPNWFLRLLSYARPELKQLRPELGHRKNISNEKVKRVFGWSPISSEEAIIATGKSLLELKTK